MAAWEFPTATIELDTLIGDLGSISKNTNHVEFELGRSKYHAKTNTITTADDERITLTGNSFVQLCNLIDVPSSYAGRMPDTLTDFTVNYLLTEGPRRPYNALVDDKGVARSLMRPDLPYVPPDALLEAIVDSFDGEAPFVHRWGVNDGKFVVQLRSPELTFEDPGGSVLFGGVAVAYDDSWKTAPVFKTFLNRLVCDNGASVNIDGRKFRVNGYSSDGVLAQANEFSSLALDQVKQMVDGLLAMQQDKIRNAESAVRNMCVQYRLPNKIKELLIRYLTDEGYLATVSDGIPSTMYDIVNLFTYVGTHDFTISVEYRDLLCEIGGGAMFAHDETCESCGSKV